MSVEILQRPEIDSFIRTWEDKPPEQVAAELASYSLETKRIPDPYHFLISPKGELLSPTAHCAVKDIVCRTHPVGELEYQALSFIEHWAANSDEGAVAWVSPPYPGLYPTSKVILSEIEIQGGAKRLFNRAIIFDFDEKECLKFAQNLANYSQNRPLLSHLDEVRATPIILNTRGMSWIHIFEELIDDPALWQEIRDGKDKQTKEAALAQARIVYQSITAKSLPSEDARRKILGMLGEKSGSCPVLFKTSTAFQVFSESALTLSKDPDFCRSCPVCGKEINCIVKAGGSCPECGAVKRCG